MEETKSIDAKQIVLSKKNLERLRTFSLEYKTNEQIT